MDKNSAPGPNGFNGTFFQHAWEIIASDVVGAVQRFFSHGYLPNGLNANFRCLLPKKPNVELISDYRPIVLRKNIALKVDIKKAFDTLDWNFIDTVLKAFGFPIIFYNWIQAIFGSAHISIMLNGALHGYFSCSRGVCLGDHLSPILFGIAEDVLSRLFQAADSAKYISCMRMSRSEFFHSHLLYADDVLLFCQATRRNCIMVDSILNIYAQASGQMCNKEKFTLYFGKGVSMARKHRLQCLLGFRPGSIPFIYLGVLIFSGRGMQLSMAGRACLISSVIHSVATHSMMIYRWPAKLLHELDKACRSFLWSGCISKRPTCPVTWNKVGAPKLHGGLGIALSLPLMRAFSSASVGKLSLPALLASSFSGTAIWVNSSILFRLGLPLLSGLEYARPSKASLMIRIAPLALGSRFSFGPITGWDTASLIAYRFQPSSSLFLVNGSVDYYHDGRWHFTEPFVNSFPYIVFDIITTPVDGQADHRS
ncbi:uncharacterized protein LOC131025603 [Salvia miltiorrhiza]|uniref:uncharacterized protein LOC131025603 n=1 Tax=Salvia miltiorrhiza TaxID=226208 RepID=UPI0025AD2F1E|nr:uncharacterized protein LOC131025603 [Salvia miltiorrhiza]